jgi:antitoxin ParD1/3/4
LPAEKLSITPPAEMVRVIRSKVESGDYSSNSEVISEATRDWLERDRHLATLTAAIDCGIADAESGRLVDSDPLRKSLLERVSKGRQSKP